MDIYSKFLEYLTANGDSKLSKKLIFEYPYTLLRTAYQHKTLRENGVFFTGSKLARALINKLGRINIDWKVYDPAAGAGDLLLNYVDKLPAAESVESTVESWSRIIYGTEIEKTFVPLIKLRLLMLAYYKVLGPIKINEIDVGFADKYFANIILGDYSDYIFDVDVVLVNPPFNTKTLDNRMAWSAGKVSNAAVFLYVLEQKYSKSVIAAILPDVIRSGSRYEKLRNNLTRYLIAEEKPYGRFDKYTDVDVFIAIGKERTAKERIRSVDNQSRIGDLFDVKVGCVVPHRDSMGGDSHYYLTAKSIVRGKEHHIFQDKIQSSHKPVKGPFIAVKRTSSPSDKTRCAASFIVSNDYFHLENHMISLKAKNPMTLASYRKMLQFLNSQMCTDFLNQAIRCRHLTVSVIKQIPIKE